MEKFGTLDSNDKTIAILGDRWWPQTAKQEGIRHARSSACLPAVAGTHAPGRGEGVEGSRRWLGDVITAVSCCRGWKGQKAMPSSGKVDDTHAPDAQLLV